MKLKMALAIIASGALMVLPAHAGPAYFHRDGKHPGRLDLRRVSIGWTRSFFLVGAELNGRLKPPYVSGKRRYILWELDTRGSKQFDYIVKFNRRVIPGVVTVPVCVVSRVGTNRKWGARTSWLEDSDNRGHGRVSCSSKHKAH